MSGYTAMTERLDPEEVKDLMSRIFGEISQVITKYEGYIERFIGDAVMAIFGVPKTHEDDPIRAIRAAREIHLVVESMSPKYEKKIGSPLFMHSGINTGLVVTGAVDVQKGTHGITGDPVNLASRLEALAPKGEILVGENTFRLAEGYFIFERLEPQRVKGKNATINAYRVIATSTRRTRFDVRIEGGLTPLVGRETELKILLQGFSRVKEGRGQVCSIISEAGLGKSRLLYEFRKSVAKENVSFLEGKCLSYGKTVAYHPIIEIIKSNFNIDDNERNEKIAEKVKNGLKVLSVDEAATLPYLLELLPVKDTGIGEAPISPEGKKDRVIEALKLISIKGSKVRPLIMAIEDLHWIDENSKDVVKGLIDVLYDANIFLILTYRPEFTPSWETRSYSSQIKLIGLSKHESQSMAFHLIGSDEIDHNIEGLIESKAEGSPFFLEEFVKSLKALKVIEIRDGKCQFSKKVKKLSIPSTIQDVIMARADSLADDVKETLQAGAAIEREFSYQLLKHVTALPKKKLLENISKLKDSELLYERGAYPESTYVFTHALTREVIYDSILNKRRKYLHDRIGHTIESLYRDNIENYYGILSEHYVLSDNFKKGAKFSRLASKQAQKRSSYSDAIFYAKKGVYCLEQLPTNVENQKRIIDARTSLSTYCMNLNFNNESMKAISPIMDLANKINHKKRLPRIYVVTGSYNFSVRENVEESIKDLKKAKALSEKNGDLLTLWFACYSLANAYFWTCDFERNLENNQILLELSKAANNFWGIYLSKYTSAIQYYYSKGKCDIAFNLSKKLKASADEGGDIFIQLVTSGTLGISCFSKGFFKEAETNLQEAVRLYKKTKQAYWGAISFYFLGELYFSLERFGSANNCYKHSILCLEPHQLYPSWVILNKLKCIQIKAIVTGEKINLKKVFKTAKQNKMKVLEGAISSTVCNILLNFDDKFLYEAEELINDAIRLNETNGIIWELAGNYALYSKLLQRKGNLLDASDKLSEALKLYTYCSAIGWVEKYEKELARLSQ